MDFHSLHHILQHDFLMDCNTGIVIKTTELAKYFLLKAFSSKLRTLAIKKRKCFNK